MLINARRCWPMLVFLCVFQKIKAIFWNHFPNSPSPQYTPLVKSFYLQITYRQLARELEACIVNVWYCRLKITAKNSFIFSFCLSFSLHLFILGSAHLSVNDSYIYKHLIFCLFFTRNVEAMKKILFYLNSEPCKVLLKFMIISFFCLIASHQRQHLFVYLCYFFVS